MSREPVPQAAESADPDDVLIASKYLNSRYPWQDPAEQVPYGRVLLIAATLKWDPAAVAVRLEALGYADIERPEGPFPGAVEPDDVRLITGVDRRFGAQPIDLGTTVSLRQVAESAALTNRAPADVARRLTDLGYRVGTGAGPLPESPHLRDITLVRADRRGEYFDWGAEVSAGQVLELAQELSCSPYVAAARMVALGLRLPYTPDPGDEQLLGHRDATSTTPNGGGWYGRWWSPPVGHILTVARETGRSHADIIARLRELGCQPPDGNVPDEPEPDDLVLLSENVDGRAPWMVKNHSVGLRVRHILRASLATGRSPAYVAGRLTELGHWLHENAILPETADEADIRLLATLTRSYKDDVHLEDVLRSATLTGRSPSDVAARLTALGHRLPDEATYPDIRPLARAE